MASESALQLLLMLLALLARPVAPSDWREDAFVGYSELNCHDKSDRCARWAADGECHNNPYYMINSCPQSCIPRCMTKLGSRPPEPHAGFVSEMGTRAFAISGLGVGTADGHIRRDPSMGHYYTPGQKLRGDPWLHMSSLGMGTRLGRTDAATDRQMLSAILKSVASGWNVIDTASSYREGRSEAVVGAALDTLINVGKISREMLFIGTKAGFLTDAPDFQRELQRAGGPPAGAVVGGHCIHPSCLEASLATSLARMNLQTVDVLYLHFAAEQQLSAVGREVFMKRMAEAFRFMEVQRAEGRIRAYGLATQSCFRVPPSSSEHLSLAEVVAIARREGGGANHGFRYIQLPVNPEMPEAWAEPWQAHGADWWEPGAPAEGGRAPVLEVAARLGVGVLGVSALQTGGRGPEQEAEMLARLTASAQLSVQASDAGKLLQMARSAPLLLSVIVGQTTEAHVLDNIQLSWQQPLPMPKFRKVYRQLTADGGPMEEL